mgnify:CR=1 FL=1
MVDNNIPTPEQMKQMQEQHDKIKDDHENLKKEKEI